MIDLTGLAMSSDNIGIDNVVFAQAIPEPTTGLLLGLALLLAGAARGDR